MLIEICDEALVQCSSLRSIAFPARVELVRFGALERCRSLCELTFEIPSAVKELDLPPSGFDSLSIPDSVEVVRGMIERLGGQNRLLRFGRESRLVELDLIQVKTFSGTPGVRKGAGQDAFVCLSEEVLRRFRFQCEGL
jgi:hypothetical protein